MLKLLAVALIAAVLGGIVGAAVYALAFEGDTTESTAVERGTVLRLAGIDAYYDIDKTPFCVALQHFCLVRLESGEPRALYTYETHPLFRDQSCEIVWLPDFALTDPATGESSLGWFKANCSGTDYRYDGERIFGPGPRDMDEFPVEQKSETMTDGDGKRYTIDYLEVDTRHLICGDTHGNGTSAPCPKAPQPQ